MRRSPVHLDLEMDEAAMRDRNLHLRRLGDDRRVGRTTAATASVPMLANSSSATAVTITSPRNPRRFASTAASMHAARLPFMSCAPRP